MALLPRRLSSCMLPFRHAVRRSLRRGFDAAGAGAEAAGLGGGRRLTFRRWGAALKRAQGAESSSTSVHISIFLGLKKHHLYAWLMV